MNKLARFALVALLFGFGTPIVSHAASINGMEQVAVCDPTTNGQQNCAKPDSSGNIPVTGTLSASIGGFPGASPTTGTPISVTSSGVTGSLPAGTVVVASNVGTTNVAYCKLGASATVNDQPISPNGGWFAFTVGAATQLTCITSTSTTTVNMVGGAGIPTGTGGGSSGGGGSNAAASATGSAVPSSGSYSAVNVGGTLRGATAVNPSGSVYAQQVDVASVAGTTVSTGAGAVGTGTARVAVGQDTATVAGAAPTTTGIYVTGPSAAALATSAKQDTINTSINSVVGTKAAGTAATNSQLGGGVYNSSAPSLTNGQQAALQMESDGDLKVAVTNNGTAQGAAISGQTPSTIACQALTSGPSVYTTATTNPVNCNEYGAIVTAPYALQDRLVKGTTSAMTGTTSTSLLAAPGSGLKNYITTLSCVNSHATVGTFVTIQDGSGGTAIWTVAAAALFGGTAITFPAPLQQPTANTALYVANVTTGANVICSASGYKAP